MLRFIIFLIEYIKTNKNNNYCYQLSILVLGIITAVISSSQFVSNLIVNGVGLSQMLLSGNIIL